MKKIICYIAGMSLLIMGCEKRSLNTVSTTSITDASAFNTQARVLTLVKGLYSSLKSGNLLGGRYFIYNDIRGENFVNQTNNAVTALDTWNFTVSGTAQEVEGLWSQAYATINQCNTFLDGMAKTGDAVVGSTLAENYHGEARLIRAICYYDLLQLYARPYWDGNGSKPGVPLRLTGITSSGYNNLARSSVDSVYLQILTDLDSAEVELPSSYTLSSGALDGTTSTIRAHVNTAIALKTRVYLSMQQYANVITEAGKIVPASAPFVAPTGVPNALASTIGSVFTTYTTVENILSMPFVTGSDVPGTQNSLGQYYYNGGTLPTEYSLNPVGVMSHTDWTTTDARRAFIDTVKSSTGALTYWLTKFPKGSPYPDWAPVIRYSEVLLNLAEARVWSTNTVDPQAVALLNAVHQRSDPSTTFTTAGFASATDLLNAILEERNIELLGEGFRSADLMRLQLTFPAKGAAPSVAATANNYIWPISAIEITDNALCAPNP